jgi:Mlc titration factor MtfA (ptsG expression regulator)
MLERMQRWLRAHRSDEPHPVPDALWARVVGTIPWLVALPPAGHHRLRQLVEAFLACKEFHGAGGMALDDEIMLSIAIQACLPILRTGIDSYRHWVGIVVYPGEFLVEHPEVDDIGVVHDGSRTLLGEAWHGGPVVVSWHAHDAPGVNVLVHEFAHTLDMANGDADGFPPLPADMDRGEWARAFTTAYEALCEQVDSGLPTAIDPYASEHPAEFFAVASEAFFETPEELHRAFPEVHGQLARLYGVDPLTRTLTADFA